MKWLVFAAYAATLFLAVGSMLHGFCNAISGLAEGDMTRHMSGVSFAISSLWVGEKLLSGLRELSDRVERRERVALESQAAEAAP